MVKINDALESAQLIADTIEDIERELLALSIELREARHKLEEIIDRAELRLTNDSDLDSD